MPDLNSLPFPPLNADDPIIRPDISGAAERALVMERAARIRVLSAEGGHDGGPDLLFYALHDMKDENLLFNQSFIWSPMRFERPADDLTAFAVVRTLHTYGYVGFFKPTLAEVLVCIPADVVSRVAGFHLVQGPQNADDLNEQHEATSAGVHVAYAVLYERAG